MGGMGGIFGKMGKNVAKKIQKDKVTTRFADVAGCSEAKKEIMVRSHCCLLLYSTYYIYPLHHEIMILLSSLNRNLLSFYEIVKSSQTLERKYPRVHCWWVHQALARLCWYAVIVMVVVSLL